MAGTGGVAAGEGLKPEGPAGLKPAVRRGDTAEKWALAHNDAVRGMRVTRAELRSVARLGATVELRKKLAEVADVLDRLEGLGWVSKADLVKGMRVSKGEAEAGTKAALREAEKAGAALREERERAKGVEGELRRALERARLGEEKVKRRLEGVEGELVEARKAWGEAQMKLLAKQGPPLGREKEAEGLPEIGRLTLELGVVRPGCAVCPQRAVHYVRLPVEYLYLCEEHVRHEIEKYKVRQEAARTRKWYTGA